jgi:hypothetical protein
MAAAPVSQAAAASIQSGDIFSGTSNSTVTMTPAEMQATQGKCFGACTGGFLAGVGLFATGTAAGAVGAHYAYNWAQSAWD